MRKRNILVTNDDGIYGPGLKPLIGELRKLGKVTAVVPDQERSGTSHSITLHKPLRVQQLGVDTYIINGTPADCVRYGILSLIKDRVDLVVSGINAGPNMGHDVIYSGTVAGAREGALLKVPAMAVSVAEMAGGDFALAATTTARIAKKVLSEKYPEGIYLNVNVPARVKGIRITSLGQRKYDDTVECRTDPRGQKYYWLVGKFVTGIHQAGTDITVVTESFASVTPLKLDPTAEELFPRFRSLLQDR